MRLSSFALQGLAILALCCSILPNNSSLSNSVFVLAQDDSSSNVNKQNNDGSASSSNTNTVIDQDIVDSVQPEKVEKYAFQAEVNRMLDIVVNSLYQNRDVFLRELISNASDALDKIRYLLLSDAETYASKSSDDDDIDLEVQIEYDSEARTLTVRDTGIGMTHDDLVRNLGTVARSGTTKFLEALRESGNSEGVVSQIGQFGVGFYSSFLVADRVLVASKNPTDAVQHVWESNNGSSDFMVYPDPRGNTLKRGTEITLHLKPDCLEYADPIRLQELAKHYSEFVMHPISLRTTSTVEVEVDDEQDSSTTDAEKKKADSEDELEVGDEVDESTQDKPKKTKEVTSFSWERLNSNQAIWTRDKDEITDDEYQAFWKVLSGNEYSNATTWTHFNAEGKINFKSLLYLPDEVPIEYSYGNIDYVRGAIRLYVRKVLIGDNFDLMPKYLGFIRGVVDSDELPLNVNRETLQESKILKVIRKRLVRKAIDLIRQFAKDSEQEASSKKDKKDDDAADELDADDDDDKEKANKYLDWYKKFSPNIKLGVLEDEPNRDKLMKLLRYETSKSNGKLVSLTDYVERMKDWQDDIYVLGGVSVEEIAKSPFLEPFKEKDLEVIYLTDAMDEYLVKSVRDFERKKFAQISNENIKFKDEDENLVKRREKYYKNKFAPLVKYLRKLYHGNVLRVQVAKRSLGSVPAVVTSSDFGNSANMERIMRAQAFQHGMDPSSYAAMKIMELNPRHPVVLKLLEGCPPEDEEAAKTFKIDPDVADSARLLLDMALLNGGFPVSDPDAHNKRLVKVMQKTLALESLKLEPEVDPPVEEDEPPVASGAGGLNMEDFNFDDLDLDMDSIKMDL